MFPQDVYAEFDTFETWNSSVRKWNKIPDFSWRIAGPIEGAFCIHLPLGESSLGTSYFYYHISIIKCIPVFQILPDLAPKYAFRFSKKLGENLFLNMLTCFTFRSENHHSELRINRMDSTVSPQSSWQISSNLAESRPAGDEKEKF